MVLFTFPPKVSARSPYEWAHVRLDYACREKVKQLNRFCDKIHDTAIKAREDTILISFFDINRRYSRVQKNPNVPEALTEKLANLRRSIIKHYIENYLCFYDILMIDPNGRILYTVRKELSSQHNVFDGETANTPLAKCLATAPGEEVFIDFQYYTVSDEPAAFFVEPVTRNGEHLGWLVLQCAINKVNSLFAGDELLGPTGETFLVNHNGYMLTESNFQGDSTILKKKLDDRNIKAKFNEKQGRRTVTDYRGSTALTSFEVVEFLKIQWLVVAKMDKDQIVSEHFDQHRQYYYDGIIRKLADSRHQNQRTELVAEAGQKVIEVDMDEFVRANQNELLRTVGVSTCTAVVATYPGKFGYLAHITPQDRVYGGQATNLLEHVINKIKTYDIYKYERSRICFFVVARHNDSLSKIVDKLIDDGFLLSQISVLRGPPGHYANVTCDYFQNQISVEWASDEKDGDPIVQLACDGQNLGQVVEHLISEASGAPEG